MMGEKRDIKRRDGLHEDLRRQGEVAPPSNRAFGLVAALVWMGIAVLPAREGGAVRVWAGAVGMVFLLAAVWRPELLGGLNRIWTRAGRRLERVVQPAVMALLFYAVFTPVGWLRRRLGKDALRRGFEPEAETYWIAREPGEPAGSSMRRQF
jgi:hypothetical protein